MFDSFIPDYYFHDIYKIPVSFFTDKGIKGVLFDIDNTLVTYDDPEPTPELLAWLKGLTDAGIRIAFVSNNSHERVALFNRSLGFHATGKSGKPSRKSMQQAMAALGTTPADTMAVGDQIFTDVWAAKRVGIPSLLVYPIKDKKTPFFRAKRLLEKPFLRRYFRQNGGSYTE